MERVALVVLVALVAFGDMAVVMTRFVVGGFLPKDCCVFCLAFQRLDLGHSLPIWF